MPPPKSKKLTAQPVRTRQFAGKPAAPEPEERSSSESESEEEQPKEKPFAKPKPAPVTSSFPKAALKSKLAARQKSEAERKALEDEFETESEGEGAGEDGSDSASGSSSEEDDSEENSSSEDEAPKKLLRPVFLKKNERNKAAAPAKSADEIAAEESARRQEQSRAIVQEQVEQRVAEKAAGKKDWDNDIQDADMDAIDDTDGLDPDAEYAAWKLRELKRIKRARLAIEEAEAERAEIERRRNLSQAERDAEDAAYIDKQKEERADRGDMKFMQKYFHKGAFSYADTDEMRDLMKGRNLMNARFEDQTDRQVLPEYMQIRDLTKLGRKGGTRYKDMKTEDTGTWGNYADDRPRRDNREFGGVDDRFKPDAYGGRDEREVTGANAKPLGERKRFGEERERDGKRMKTEERG
jgi:microfibrillar-associated protein 1